MERRVCTRDMETSFYHEPINSLVSLVFVVDNPEITVGRFNYRLKTKTVKEYTK